MTIRYLVLFVAVILTVASCSNSNICDSNQAYNKMLALGKVQARVVAKGGDAGMEFASMFAAETGVVSELIAQKKYGEACQKADAIAKKYGMDLANEEKGMMTIEQLTKDGGKGKGICSVADVAIKQMELHALLQAEVNAGRKGNEVFQQFNKDTVGLGDLMTTNPSKACELLERIKSKYKL